MPQGLLIKIFETQQHALDNCAAACACSGWYSAVTCSHIPALHLHANGVHNRDWSCNGDWNSFLSSRSSLGKLQVSRPAVFSVAESSWVQHIPSTCTSLVTSGYPEYFHQGTDSLMHLQELTVGNLNTSHCVSSLVHLTQLRSLHLVRTNCRPDSFPTSLQQLHLHAVSFVPHALHLGSLMQLSGLEIREMPFRFAETDLTKLQNLQNLNLEDSDILASPAALLELTWLTSLNLSGSLWLLGASGLSADAFAIFRAWPLLQVLKVDNCHLFEATTRFEAPRVQDLQVSWVTENEQTFTRQARWSIVEPTAMQSPMSDYCCLQYLIALQITADSSADAPFYAEALRQALSNFLFLESLSLTKRGPKF